MTDFDPWQGGAKIIAWIAIYEPAHVSTAPLQRNRRWATGFSRKGRVSGNPKRCYYTVSKRRQDLLCSCGGPSVRFDDAHAMETCAHIRALLDGKIVEKPLPKLPHGAHVPFGLVNVPHVSLSKDGESLLRWRWAAAALRHA